MTQNLARCSWCVGDSLYENYHDREWGKPLFDDQNLFEFLAWYQSNGVQYTICTDISKDGMLGGPSFILYEKIQNETKVKLIASGGISTIDELPRLADLGCEGTIIGKALYEKRISLKELESFILTSNDGK